MRLFGRGLVLKVHSTLANFEMSISGGEKSKMRFVLKKRNLTKFYSFLLKIDMKNM